MRLHASVQGTQRRAFLRLLAQVPRLCFSIALPVKAQPTSTGRRSLVLLHQPILKSIQNRHQRRLIHIAAHTPPSPTFCAPPRESSASLALVPIFKYAQEAMCERRLLLKRREFLKNSLAVGVAASFTGVAFLESATSEVGSEPAPGMFNAQMIWCAESVPVPLKTNGPASGIASSSDSHAKIATPDLHAVFAREFTLDALPTEAAVRLFAYTRYRLYINGVYCGRGPSRFQNQRPEYDTREITGALKMGCNLIAVLVHHDAPTGRIMRHEPGFAANLYFSNGEKEQVISTDAKWVCRPDLSIGPRDQAWSSIEEHIDGRKALDLTDLKLSLSGWPASVPAGGPDFFPVWPRTTPLQSETRHPWNAGATDLSQKRVDLQPGQQASFALDEIIQGYHILEFNADAGSELEISYQIGRAHV